MKNYKLELASAPLHQLEEAEQYGFDKQAQVFYAAIYDLPIKMQVIDELNPDHIIIEYSSQSYEALMKLRDIYMHGTSFVHEDLPIVEA